MISYSYAELFAVVMLNSNFPNEIICVIAANITSSVNSQRPADYKVSSHFSAA